MNQKPGFLDMPKRPDVPASPEQGGPVTVTRIVVPFSDVLRLVWFVFWASLLIGGGVWLVGWMLWNGGIKPMLFP